MNVVILGGDGYLGWPTAMYFSNRSYSVTVIDSYFRRDACKELDTQFLYPVPTLVERAKIWHELTGYEIKVVVGDLAQPEFMRSVFNGEVNYDWAIDHNFTGVPNTVVHFAEQPSAPYSLYNHRYADFTLVNNLRVTNNLVWAIKDYAPKTHIIKLGTMGEYGTPNIDIEEGWLEIEHNNRKDKFLFPRQAGSLYHTTKIMDTDLLWFAVRMWDLRVTDLMQGPVYGVETEESEIDQRLRTIFNYDEIFGTIINRFIVQAVVNYPLTVYGEGGQTRGYLNLKDTLQCVHISESNPATRGELRIFNQIMEIFSVNELASLIQRVGNELGYDVQIEHIENPRKESESHYYNPTYQGLQDLGVVPHFLTDDVMRGLFEAVKPYQSSVCKNVIFKGVKWT